MCMYVCMYVCVCVLCLEQKKWREGECNIVKISEFDWCAAFNLLGYQPINKGYQVSTGCDLENVICEGVQKKNICRECFILSQMFVVYYRLVYLFVSKFFLRFSLKQKQKKLQKFLTLIQTFLFLFFINTYILSICIQY